MPLNMTLHQFLRPDESDDFIHQFRGIINQRGGPGLGGESAPDRTSASIQHSGD
jgi:hypothetical protein